MHKALIVWCRYLVLIASLVCVHNDFVAVVNFLDFLVQLPESGVVCLPELDVTYEVVHVPLKRF